MGIIQGPPSAHGHPQLIFIGSAIFLQSSPDPEGGCSDYLLPATFVTDGHIPMFGHLFIQPFLP